MLIACAVAFVHLTNRRVLAAGNAVWDILTMEAVGCCIIAILMGAP